MLIALVILFFYEFNFYYVIIGFVEQIPCGRWRDITVQVVCPNEKCQVQSLRALTLTNH